MVTKDSIEAYLVPTLLHGKKYFKNAFPSPILGNGTQLIFIANKRVLYISLHRLISYIYLVVIVSVCRFDVDKVYPKSPEGGSQYTGDGEGQGATANFAFAAEGMEDHDYQPSFTAALLMIQVKSP